MQQQYIGLIKAEPQNGFIVTNGNLLNLLKDIFLTTSQRLYKIGFFLYLSDEIPVLTEGLQVFVFDDMMKTSSGDGMTRYFATNFLGCKTLITAATKTKLFYDITSSFIEKSDLFTPDKKVRKVNALHVYLKESQSQILSPASFADTYFDKIETKNQYLSAIDQSGEILRDASITKDLTKIKRELAVRKVRFTSNVKITYPSSEEIADLFQVGEYDTTTDYTHVKIKGKVTKR